MKKKNDLTSFVEKFGTEEKCFKHLCELKWGAGFTCRKCAHTIGTKGHTWHHRRCKKCGYDESCTAHTLFHKLKFPVVKAFLIVYQISTMKKGMSTHEIARQHGIHQETAWFFKRKVQQAMRESKQPLLTGMVQVDEAVIGGFEKGAIGRSRGKRQRIQMAVEVDLSPDGRGNVQIKNANARVIDNYSSDELANAMDEMIDANAIIISDEWPSYPKAVKNRPHFAEPSEKGESMPQIHRMIFNLKNWIRGIHHHVSPDHLQSYIDEFFFRFNKRNQLKSISSNLLLAMVNHQWFPYKSAIAA
jgi:hypothetical protein